MSSLSERFDEVLWSEAADVVMIPCERGDSRSKVRYYAFGLLSQESMGVWFEPAKLRVRKIWLRPVGENDEMGWEASHIHCDSDNPSAITFWEVRWAEPSA